MGKWATVVAVAALFTVAGSVLTAPGARAEGDNIAVSKTVTLYAVEDASVNQAQPNQYYGSGPLLLRGQQNPQTTGSEGKYAFFLEEGTYRLLVRKDGYQPFLSQPWKVEEGVSFLGRDISLSMLIPEVDDELLVDFAITPLGFDPPITTLGWTDCLTCTAAAGDAMAAAPLLHWREPLTATLRFTNLDISGRAVRLSADLPRAAAATEAESGLLDPGDSYIVQIEVDPHGVIELSDPTDPTVVGSVQLVEAVLPDNSIYLPLLRR